MVSDVWLMASLWQLLSLPKWFVAFVAIVEQRRAVTLSQKIETEKKENVKNDAQK